MPEPSSEDRRAAEAEGLWGHLAGLLGAKLAYWRARAELAGIEGREAAVHYGIALGLAVGGIVLLVFSYVFLVLAAVFAIAWMCGGGNAWIWVLLGAALLHLVAAGGLFLAVRMKIGRPVFTATLEEFRKDQAWLTTPAKPN
jgi:uncharacterized membrane protein YqjE